MGKTSAILEITDIAQHQERGRAMYTYSEEENYKKTAEDDYDYEFDGTEDEDDDDDILAGIETRKGIDIDDEDEKEKPARRVKKATKAEAEPAEVKNVRKRSRIGTVISVAAMVAVFLAGELYAAKYIKDNKLFMFEEEKPHYEVLGTRYSASSKEAEIDDDIANLYRFMLSGEHEALANSGSGVVSFNFGENNAYSGYSSSGNDSFGEYKIKAENGKYLLTTNCNGTIDTYELEMSENRDIVLRDNTDHVYTLQ